ncbi:MAG: hypothetical protein R3F20_14550 [Planctomycetota bacterium]
MALRRAATENEYEEKVARLAETREVRRSGVGTPQSFVARGDER